LALSLKRRLQAAKFSSACDFLSDATWCNHLLLAISFVLPAFRM
jgi:hypothetical protein